jgi:enoyl-CoA hydratase
MDLILTGRPVAADEALAMGLANRAVPDGQALEAAIALARQIAAFPQGCMRNDRQSALEQWSLDWDSATAREIALGYETLNSGETAAGAARFTDGQGRGGRF